MRELSKWAQTHEHAVGKMALINLFNTGLPQTFKV